ncbi:MAG: hypothetical protein CSB13_01400 [Chloroflexi bacterium]|nr:MAG: hypothetical protein CSB13_01400 [Chloroflexota bacterium]
MKAKHDATRSEPATKLPTNLPTACHTRLLPQEIATLWLRLLGPPGWCRFTHRPQKACQPLRSLRVRVALICCVGQLVAA